jgi:GNAT superfamily N-acetyltransferase
MQVIDTDPTEESRSHAGSGITPLSSSDFALHAPDAHYVAYEAGEIVARCSTWWTSAPHLNDHRPGLIGHYAAVQRSAADAVLQRACERLRSEGCTLAIGPLDGSTWRRYRLVTQRIGMSPAFFLEPDNPDSWPRDFERCGFTPLAQYRSALTTDLDDAAARAAAAHARFRRHGLRLRPFDSENADVELRRLYQVSLASFSNNFLYTPVGEPEFTRQYRGLLPFVRSEFISIVEDETGPIAFMFAIPDALEAARTRDGFVSTLIVKTVAVAPRWRGAGVGSMLLHHTHALARQQGFTRAIHALMHETNVSQHMSGDRAVTIRRYTLFARPL